MKRAQVTVPLDIPDVRILSTEINKVGELIITIESTKEGTNCRQCRREIRKRDGDGAPEIDLVDGDQLVEKLKQLSLGVITENVEIEEVSIDPEWYARL